METLQLLITTDGMSFSVTKLARPAVLTLIDPLVTDPSTVPGDQLVGTTVISGGRLNQVVRTLHELITQAR